MSVLDFEDLKIDSSRERLDFSRRISEVINGLDGVDGTEEVFIGACLSSRVERVSENCCTRLLQEKSTALRQRRH